MTAGPRLRIAFVVHDYTRVLGHSRYVAELAERFAADHDVHVFANRFENLPPGITRHRVPAVRFSALWVSADPTAGNESGGRRR